MKEGLDRLISRNVSAIAKLRRRAQRRRSVGQRFADSIFCLAGGMRFVMAHLVVFAAWIVVNTGVLGEGLVWDPYPFVMLTTVVSLEAILLSSLVLASQNRTQRLADQNADLDLHVNLLAEHEVTRILQRVDAIAKQLGLEEPRGDTDALKQELAPSKILQALVHEAGADEHRTRSDHEHEHEDGEHARARRTSPRAAGAVERPCKRRGSGARPITAS